MTYIAREVLQGFPLIRWGLLTSINQGARYQMRILQEFSLRELILINIQLYKAWDY